MMLKRALAFSVFTILGTNFAAAQQPVVWEGRLFITLVEGACTGGGEPPEVGEVYTSVLRPRLTINDPDTSNSLLSMIGARKAHAFRRDDTAKGWTGTGSYTGDFISSRAGGPRGYLGGTFDNFVTVPANVKASTQYVDLTGKLSKFEGKTDCTVTLQGSYSQRPD